MCVIVTRDVPMRFRGFLASCMLEIAPGVYTQPDMNPAVRDRVWRVLRDWWVHYVQGSIVMTWDTPGTQHRQEVRTLGIPAKDVVEYDGMFVVRRDDPDAEGGPPHRPAWPVKVTNS